jgi:hypothetical protein
VWNADALGTSLDTSIYAAYNGDNVNDSSGNARNGTNVNNVTFTTGKVGNALTFNGGNYVNLGNDKFNFAGNFSISAWINLNTVSGNQCIMSNLSFVSPNVSNGWLFVMRNNRIQLEFYKNNNTYNGLQSSSTFSTSTWYHITVVRVASQSTKLYINGVLDSSNTSTYNPTYASTIPIPSSIGAWKYDATNTSQFTNGKIDALNVWDKALTDNEVLSLYNEGTGAEYPFSSQLLPSLNDVTPNANHGTRPSTTLTGGVPGPSFTTGKIGKAFLFDGVNDMVALPNSSFDFTGDFSISTWVKITSNPSSGGAIFSNYNYDVVYNYGYLLILNANKTVAFGTNNAVNSTVVITSTTALALNTWYHITVRRDSVTKSNYLYINGTLEAQVINTGVGITYGTRAMQPTIGAIRQNNQGTLSSNNFLNGQVDALTIWNKALTTSEVSALYNSGNTQQYPFSNVALSGVTSDALGNYDGTNNGVTFTTGKLGTNSFSFNGSSNFVALPQSALNFNKGNSGQSIGDFSVSFWLNLNTGSGDYQTVIGNWGDKGFGWQVVMFGGSFTFFGSDGSNGSTARIQHSLGLSKATATNQWVHVVVAYTNQSQIKSYVNGVLTNTTSTTYQVKTNSRNNGNLGCFPQSGDNSSTKYWFLNGKLDAVTLWTKALTDTEASALYNDGTGYQHPYPSSAIGYTSTLDDATSNANHGTRPSSTLTGGALGPSFTAGKIGQAFTFDGVNDYVALPNNIMKFSNTDNWSVSFWIYQTAGASSGVIGNWDYSGGQSTGWGIRTGGTAGGDTSKFTISLFTNFVNGSGNLLNPLQTPGTTSINTWNHFVITRNSSAQEKIYQNGTLVASQTNPSTKLIYPATSYSCIGAERYQSNIVGYAKAGSKIDAMSVWNKELSASEITELYNSGTGKQYPNY